MYIRSYTPEDLHKITELLNRSMNLDEFTPELLSEKINDPDYDENLTLISEDKGDITGFISGVVRNREQGKTGYIKLIATDPDYYRTGVATALLEKVEAGIKAAGANIVKLFESFPNYYMPGLDPFYTEAVCLFERRGYKRTGDCSNLRADLTASSFDTAVEENHLLPEIVIRRAGDGDKISLSEWITENFKGWESEVAASFKNKPASIFIALENEKIIAFSAYENNNIGTGWFGPMGTTDACRGKGIGGILLKQCLKEMKHLGYKSAIIPWVGPIPFYMHYCNSKVDRVFWRYEKQL